MGLPLATQIRLGPVFEAIEPQATMCWAIFVTKWRELEGPAEADWRQAHAPPTNFFSYEEI